MIFPSSEANRYEERYSPMPIKAVTFDLWLTLIWDSKDLEEYRKLRRLVNFYRFAKRVHIYAEEKDDTTSSNNNEGATTVAFRYNDVRLALEKMQVELDKHYEKGYDLHPKERGKLLFDMMGIKFSSEQATKIYERAGNILSNSGYYSGFPHINAEAMPTMTLLKKKFPSLKIALISNAARSAKTYKRILRALGVGDYFDHLVISCEAGYLKPRREIFEEALSLLSIEPLEALHVGDLYRTDVIGAASCGMNACLYTGLWQKYASFMNPGEHIPKSFKPQSRKQIVTEIGRLQDAVGVAQQIP